MRLTGWSSGGQVGYPTPPPLGRMGHLPTPPRQDLMP